MLKLSSEDLSLLIAALEEHRAINVNLRDDLLERLYYKLAVVKAEDLRKTKS